MKIVTVLIVLLSSLTVYAAHPVVECSIMLHNSGDLKSSAEQICKGAKNLAPAECSREFYAARQGNLQDTKMLCTGSENAKFTLDCYVQMLRLTGTKTRAIAACGNNYYVKK